MNKLKRTLILSAGVASVGVAGLAGITTASALTNTHSSTGTSIIDKIASKFNLNKDDVKAVFDEDRAQHQADMKEKRTEALKTALSDGKITQAQYDHIVTAQNEIDALMDSSESPREQSDETKAAIKSKFDALRTWMKDQNLTPSSLGLGFGVRGHGHGPEDGTNPTDTTN